MLWPNLESRHKPLAMKHIVFFFIVACLASCTFNKQFYLPVKLHNLKEIAAYNTETHDITYVHLDGDDRQVRVTNKQNKIQELNYNIVAHTFRSKNGNKLYGWLLTPKHSETHITLLFLHGNSDNFFSDLPAVIPLVKKGFEVFVIDYSGFGFSEGKATRSNVLTDANASLDYLHNIMQKGNSLVIYGQSLGGQIAAACAAENQTLINGLVLEGAPSSHKAIGAYSFPHLKFFANLLIHEGYSTVKAIQKIHKPVLVIQSTEDKTVPYEMGQTIFEHANEPKSFYKIQHDHITGPLFYADSISYKIENMLKAN